MTTDHHKASEELREVSLFSQVSSFPPPPNKSPLTQDINHPRAHSNLDERQVASQNPSASHLVVSGVHGSEDPRDDNSQLPPSRAQVEDSDGDLDIDEEEAEMSGSRPVMHRPNDGRSQQPLLKDDGRGRPSYESPNGSARPAFVSRSSTFRSRSPDLEGKSATKKKYTYAAFFLLLSLVSFTIQTETAVYIQHTLGWKKAYCML